MLAKELVFIAHAAAGIVLGAGGACHPGKPGR